MDPALLDSAKAAAGGGAQEKSLLREYAERELNAILWFLLIAITALLLRKVVKLFVLWAKGAKIPGPPCPSFYGHSSLVTDSKFPRNLPDLLQDSHEKYGSIVKLWLGPAQLLVSVKDPTLIKEMLLKAGDKVPMTERAFRLAFGRLSLFASSFDKVHERRESLAMELSGKLIEGTNAIPMKVLDCVMERIQDMMTVGSLDCQMISQHMAFAILGTTLFGDAFLAWPKATVYEELLMNIAKDACFWASYRIIPFWKRGFWRYQHLCIKLKCLTQDIIQQCRQNCKLFCQMDKIAHNETANFEMEGEHDVPSSGCATLGNILLRGLDHLLDAKEEPCGNIMGVMFHGCLTSAILIGNILARLATHPEIQDKIYEEIIMVRKGSQKQDQQGVNKMPFLLATVYESARLLPAGPLLQRCSLKYDLNLKGGVTIPSGTLLVVPIQLVQTDDSSWGKDAGQFNPYRFLLNAGKISDLLHLEALTGAPEELADPGQSSFVLNDPNETAAFLPFGSGVRACVGQKFAIFRIGTLFAALLEQYEVRLDEGSNNDQKSIMNDPVLPLPPTPKIIFARRNGQTK
ncbi:uncharacterized protein LOC131163641 [Malania oleifera]|uniref:uncharacterized protein LOC131163641 n=1 Tax=Malania oleifera TaxID=397392 RepID=UPI0025AE4A76|nr:uncharacterized protein LOC131163641 [Malania oleifera]